MPGQRWRTSRAASIPSRWKVGRHADVGDQHVGLAWPPPPPPARRSPRPRRPPEVGLPLEQGPDALPDDHVVVGQEDVDGGGRAWRVLGIHDDQLCHIVRRQAHRAGARQAAVVPATPSRTGDHRVAGPTPGSGWQHANRELGDLPVVDPLRSGRGAAPVWPSTPGSPTTTSPRPTPSSDLEALRTGRPVPLRQRAVAPGWRPTPDGAVTDVRLLGGRADGLDHGGGRRAQPRVRGGGPPRAPAPPEVGDGWVRFTQTAGGRTGLPAPRRVRRRPFVQWQAPLVWATLSLTLHADGAAGVRGPRGQPVPPPLVLRRRRAPGRQVGPHRLQGLVPQVVRPAHPVG